MHTITLMRPSNRVLGNARLTKIMHNVSRMSRTHKIARTHWYDPRNAWLARKGGPAERGDFTS
jgi:hypothetical protein